MKSGTVLMLAMIMLISMSNKEVAAFEQGQCEQQCLNSSKHCVESALFPQGRGMIRILV